MTSELRVDNLKGSTTGGSISVLGEGTSATTNLQQGLAKVWVNYDAVDQGTRGSFNQSSLSDNATGDFTTSHTNNLASAEDKCASFNCWNTTDDGSNISSGAERGGITGDQKGSVAQSTSSLNWCTYEGSTSGANGGKSDLDGTYCSIHGDLA